MFGDLSLLAGSADEPLPLVEEPVCADEPLPRTEEPARRKTEELRPLDLGELASPGSKLKV